MKLTLAWLKDHLDTTADLKTVVETLTRIGLEVDGVDDPSARLGAFTVADLSAIREAGVSVVSRAATSCGRRVVDRIPSADTLDRLAYKCVVFGFPLFGLGVICGAIWAESAWGRFWGWDPKETVSFIAWVIYAAYLHARATAGWRNNAAAWINVAGFVALLFNLFIINLVVSGLHSYAGL